jgi:ATP-binding cassette, subfamily B, bacterial
LAGIFLTLAATAAGLIWPYLTMPLIDNVLIPWQNLDTELTVSRYFQDLSPYLIGLIGSALLAWLLGWARTYVMSLLSEQVSGDLRNETYKHLQKLSLDFYGAKAYGRLDFSNQ